MAQEPVPKTEEEAQAFKTKYEGLMQASAPVGSELRDVLNERITRVYGLKAALNVLDVATEHSNRFVKALQNSTNPRTNRFYHEQIGNIDKTVQNLQGAAASILQTTENIITNNSRWREAVEAGHSDGLDWYFNNANRHAQDSISINTQYAEAIRAGDPQTARNLAQAATCYRNAAEARLVNRVLAEQWHCAGIAFFEAAAVRAAGNQRVSDLYTRASTFFKNAAEATLDNNIPLAFQLTEAGFALFNASEGLPNSRRALYSISQNYLGLDF